MGKIVTYKNDRQRGMFCQIKLDNGEKVFISIAQSGAKISKMKLGGLIPGETIWESNDVKAMVELFGDENSPNRDLLDSIVAYLVDCKTLEEAKQKLVW